MTFDRTKALEEMRCALLKYTTELSKELSSLIDSFFGKRVEVNVKDITSKFKKLKGFLKDLENIRAELDKIYAELPESDLNV